jgi:mRNA interferase RelE/StbE
MAASRKICKVLISDDAADFIRSQPRKIQRQIMMKIDSLAENPRVVGEPIKNSKDAFKIRSGWYRIAYQIKDDKLLVLVIRIGHRSDFYQYYDR